MGLGLGWDSHAHTKKTPLMLTLRESGGAGRQAGLKLRNVAFMIVVGC